MKYKEKANRKDNRVKQKELGSEENTGEVAYVDCIIY